MGDFLRASKDKTSVKTLLLTVKEACDAMRPMILHFYNAVNGLSGGESSSLKADKSAFTIADGIVQYLFIQHLFKGNKFLNIVGEENCDVNIETRPYTVDELKVPEEYFDEIDVIKIAVGALSSQIDGEAFSKYTIFIDPIDGTREFTTGLGEQCTILVGIANVSGKSIGGAIYRPVGTEAIFALGCAQEKFTYTNVKVQDNKGNKLTTTNGSISAFTKELISGGMEQVKSGGAGNKSLLLLEGKAAAYIQDRGVSRWDTCGPEAVLNAFGGMMLKLAPITEDPDAFLAAPEATRQVSTYTYLMTDTNLDFVPNLSNLTPYNAINPNSVKKGEKVMATDVTMVKPYANLLGHFALAPTHTSEEKVVAIVKIIKEASSKASASFD
jgi:3'-phosphoadenosine 5'-phosphosulfate (PAPS) 3'-phosphatase